jgi:hypothetical protein
MKYLFILMLLFGSLYALEWKVEYNISGIVDDIDFMEADSTYSTEFVVTDSVISGDSVMVYQTVNITTVNENTMRGLDWLRVQIKDKADFVFIEPKVELVDFKYLDDDKVYVEFKIKGLLALNVGVNDLSTLAYTYFNALMIDFKWNFNYNIGN